MTALLTALLLAFADPPATTDLPKGGTAAEAPTKDSVQKGGAKKAEPKKEDRPSLFKKKRTQPKKDEPEDAGLTPEGPAPAKQEEKEKPKSRPTEADKDLAKSLGGTLGEDEDDPLARAAQRMRAVEEQLAKLQVEQETVVTQDKIVADLKEIIERAKKRQQQQQQQQQNQQKDQKDQQSQQQQQQQAQRQQKQQQQQSNQAAQKDGGPQKTKEQLAKGREQRDVWGHLPQMERELLQQSFKEDKLSAFKTQLEKYYTKIAEKSAEKDK